MSEELPTPDELERATPPEVEGPESLPDLEKQMERHAADAVTHARTTFGVELDLSPVSVGALEAIAQAVYQLLQDGDELSDAEFDLLCKIYGGHLGEIIRENIGGVWEYDLETMPGVAVISLGLAHGRIFPPMKWARRIERGSEEDLRSYYEKINSAESGETKKDEDSS